MINGCDNAASCYPVEKNEMDSLETDIESSFRLYGFDYGEQDGH